MKNKLNIRIFALHLLILILVISPFFTNAQGCSDAGFCTIGELKGSDPDSGYFINSFKIGLGYGAGLEGTQSVNPYLEFHRRIGPHFSIQSKIAASYATGDLGSHTGPGDVYFTGSYSLNRNPGNGIAFLAGIKIPLDNPDATNDDNLPLPMDYQSSLGTYDVIAGLRYAFRNKLEFNAGVQLPVSGKNSNNFLPQLYSDSISSSYSPTRKFERKPDVLLRVGYPISENKSKLIFRPSLLAIYHIANDSFTDLSGNEIEINGSEGLTVNLTINITRSLGKSQEIELLLGAPLEVRDKRPDGLTRSIVAGLQYTYRFGKKDNE